MTETSSESNEVWEIPPTTPERVMVEMEKAREMKIGELKMKLQASGVLTSGFCEKEEFVRAYAEFIAGEDKNPSSSADLEQSDDGEDFDGDQQEDGAESVVGGLPSYVQQRVEKLKVLHEEREKGMNEYLAERAKLEAKYQALAQPLYKKRADIIAGKFDEEIAKQNDDNPIDANDSDIVKGVPQFWVLALAHMEAVADLLTEEDIACLESLEDVNCVDNENGKGFMLSFHFSENDYFENKVLTKEYEVPNLLLSDEPILKNVIGCDIQWKEGKSLTFSEVTQKQRGKGKNAGQVRTIVKKEKRDSFFHFFSPPKIPDMESMNEEEAVRLEAAFDADYDLAQAFRLKIIPKAILWYTGHATEQEMEAAMDGLEWPTGQTTSGGDETPECKQS